MDCLDLTLPTLADNLALDEALLLNAEAGGGEVLRFWEWPHLAVVLGGGSRLGEDVNETACLADGVPIQRRASGGGTVLLGAGCLLYSLILAYERSPLLHEIPSSYRYILGRLQNALEELVPAVEPAGTSDLAVAGQKVSGNAQQRKRSHLLHHGTLLYEFPLDRVGQYLHLPVRQPDYRQARPHDVFLTNLPLTAGELKARLRSTWEAHVAAVAWPEELVRALTAEKYTRREWVRRR
jgi:lipoate-protein ligase A